MPQVNLGQAEWEILQYVGERHPVTVREVADQMATDRGLAGGAGETLPLASSNLQFCAPAGCHHQEDHLHRDRAAGQAPAHDLPVQRPAAFLGGSLQAGRGPSETTAHSPTM